MDELKWHATTDEYILDIYSFTLQTLYEALIPLTLSIDYLNPFYFQSHTLAFHSQLQHVIPLPCINLCNAPL